MVRPAAVLTTGRTAAFRHPPQLAGALRRPPPPSSEPAGARPARPHRRHPRSKPRRGRPDHTTAGLARSPPDGRVPPPSTRTSPPLEPRASAGVSPPLDPLQARRRPPPPVNAAGFFQGFDCGRPLSLPKALLPSLHPWASGGPRPTFPPDALGPPLLAWSFLLPCRHG